ncbi:MAG: hypothetical protein RBU23_00575 [Candidatus Auribacterota bacterium]|jgi:hypothetical protein|nr:hypothetical protein [Candidatus Auribacterota bacterium]
MKCFAVFFVVLYLWLINVSPSVALLGNDAFDFFDSSKWTVLGDENRVRVANGKAEFAPIDGELTGYVWQLNPAYYNESWSARIDVFLPSSGLDLDEMAGVDMYIVWPIPNPLDTDPLNYVAWEVEREGIGSGIIVGEYIAMKKTGAAKYELDDAETSSYTLSLRVDWNSLTKLFSFFYDDDGGQDNWTLLTSVDINDWGMTDGDEFGIGIVGWASDTSLDFSDGLAVDNFNAVPLPEPGAMMLFALIGMPYLLHRVKRTAR